jgi:hypothetical protein
MATFGGPHDPPLPSPTLCQVIFLRLIRASGTTLSDPQ